jgi:hypothetical protein
MTDLKQFTENALSRNFQRNIWNTEGRILQRNGADPLEFGGLLLAIGAGTDLDALRDAWGVSDIKEEEIENHKQSYLRRIAYDYVKGCGEKTDRQLMEHLYEFRFLNEDLRSTIYQESVNQMKDAIEFDDYEAIRKSSLAARRIMDAALEQLALDDAGMTEEDIEEEREKTHDMVKKLIDIWEGYLLVHNPRRLWK